MRRTTALFALLIVLIFVSKNSFAQPANDNCSSPTSLTPSTSCSTTSATLYQATIGSPTSSCGTAYDEWFSFTVPANSNCVTIDVAATGGNLSSANTFFEAFSGTSCSPSLLGTCTAAGTTLTLTGLTSSATYYTRVFTTTNPTANPSSKWNFTICATYYTIPSNDDCASATTLTMGTTNSSGTVWLATASSGIPTGCATGTPDDDVWYKFVATSSSTDITLSSISSNLSTSGAMLQLFSGSCGALTSVACGNTSISSTSLVIGDTYYVRVYSSGSGSIGGSPSGSSFSITATANYVPGNDECSNAYLLPTSTTCYNEQGTVTGATASAGIPIGACTGTPDDDVWYKFVATKSNPTITLSSISTNLSTSGSRLQLFSGTCGSVCTDP